MSVKGIVERLPVRAEVVLLRNVKLCVGYSTFRRGKELH